MATNSKNETNEVLADSFARISGSTVMQESMLRKCSIAVVLAGSDFYSARVLTVRPFLRKITPQAESYSLAVAMPDSVNSEKITAGLFPVSQWDDFKGAYLGLVVKLDHYARESLTDVFGVFGGQKQGIERVSYTQTYFIRPSATNALHFDGLMLGGYSANENKFASSPMNIEHKLADYGAIIGKHTRDMFSTWLANESPQNISKTDNSAIQAYRKQNSKSKPTIATITPQVNDEAIAESVDESAAD